MDEFPLFQQVLRASLVVGHGDVVDVDTQAAIKHGQDLLGMDGSLDRFSADGDRQRWSLKTP